MAAAMLIGILLVNKLDSAPGVQRTLDSGRATSTTIDDFGGSFSSPTTAALAVARPPGSVKVLVANGSKLNGAAGRRAAALTALRYQVSTATVSSPAPVLRTTVQFAPGFEADAKAVADGLKLPATTVIPLDISPVVDVGPANVLVVLGVDAG